MLYFEFGGVIRLIEGGQRGIKSAVTVDSEKMIIIYGTTKKHWYKQPDQAATALPDVEVRLSLSTNVNSKYKNKRKKYQRIKGYQTWIYWRQWFILMQRPYQQILSREKMERYMLPLLMNQIGLATRLRGKSRGEVINCLMF